MKRIASAFAFFSDIFLRGKQSLMWMDGWMAGTTAREMRVFSLLKAMLHLV